MEPIHVKRDYDSDIKFTGTLIATVNGGDGYKKINLYLTDSNLRVVESVNTEILDNEIYQRKDAKICKNDQEIIDFLGYTELSKALCAAAGIQYWIEA